MGLDLGYFPKLGRRQAQRLDFDLMETLSLEPSNIQEKGWWWGTRAEAFTCVGPGQQEAERSPLASRDALSGPSRYAGEADPSSAPLGGGRGQATNAVHFLRRRVWGRGEDSWRGSEDG